MRRKHWRSLEGAWQFAYDDEARWSQPDAVVFDRTITVPYPPESLASGIHDESFHPVLWYRRVVPLSQEERGRSLLLHFGAIDYAATVWVNGQLVAQHRGGHTPFFADVTEQAHRGQLDIVVRADDDPHDLGKPRGKQDWLGRPHEIWYPRTSGIWQPVWLEPVPSTRIGNLAWTPFLDQWQMGFEAELDGPMLPGMSVRLLLKAGAEVLCDDRYAVSQRELSRRIAFADPGIDDYRNQLLWSPQQPTLLQAEVELWHGDQRLDSVSTYTALRSVGVSGNRFMLNGRPYYLRMVLDQGYWPHTLLAAPDAQALRKDAELVKELGFNGVRKHQKLEDPRWLYECDRLGLLVWSEMPSTYRFTPTAVQRTVAEWTWAIRRDRSHPCIVAWVPLNESWGVPDLPTNPAHRDYVRALYHLTKTLDPTRPVVGNDGWEHLATDLITIHDYASNPAVLRERYGTAAAAATVLAGQQPGGRPLMLSGFTPDEHPIILSEFGGIACVKAGESGWGYSTVLSTDDFVPTYAALLDAAHDCRGLAGFCYTQLTDTFQEKNGLCFADRTPKGELPKLAAATRGKRRAFAMDVDPR